jgi:MFS family permease
LRIIFNANLLKKGCIFPSVGAFLVEWVPKYEKSRIFAMVFSGTFTGSIISLISGGYFCHTVNGWQTIFYSFGKILRNHLFINTKTNNDMINN